MQNDLMVFQNQEFGEIRSVMINNEPWFVGKDVASVLGYSNPSKVLTDHVDPEDKLNNDSLSSLGQRGGWLINESGMYSLILSSKLPNARKFKRWATGEVLPSIRKHGAYLTPDKVEEVLLNPDTIIKIAQNLKEEQEKRRQLEIENNELKPKANYCEQVLQSENAVVTTQIAKDYGMSPQALNSILHELGVQYKVDGQWVLYSKYQDKGYTKSCTVIDRFGEPRMQTKWTQKGRLFIYQMLKTIGVLPNIEREVKKLAKKTKTERKVSPAEPIFAKLLALYENKEINKTEFARCCSVTSPTLNKMISKYKEEMCS
jgi:BRO|nr:MAG TPA: repressor domain protein [Caudoviricetes sp.]